MNNSFYGRGIVIDDVELEYCQSMNIINNQRLDILNIKGAIKMGTTATTPEVTNVTSERYDVVVGYDLKKVKDEEGKEVVKKVPAMYAFSSEEDQKNVKEMETAGTFQADFQVTVSQPLAKTFDGIKQICPDEEEACNNFNRGAKQKGSNRLKAALLDVDQDGKFTFADSQLTNGVFDLTSEIASPTKKKSLTEEEKLDRFLSTFPEAVRASMKAAYTAAKAPQAA